jgi:two-component system sensor histidine kinase YesM
MVFSIVNQLRDIRDPSNITGVIKVDANYSGIQSICGKVKMGEKGRLYIIDENRNIIYPENLSAEDLDTDSRSILFMESNSKKSPYTANLEQGSYLVNTANVASSNWTVVAVNSLSELNRSAAKTRDMSFFLAFLFSLLTTVVFIIFYKRFLTPLISIVRLMKEVQNGNLSAKYVQKSNDEIGYLGASFNSMLSRINEMLTENTSLVKQVYEYRLLQKEAQFSALYSQIKPHFIYNTLNMISLSMQCGKYKNAINNINMLSRLLRGLTNMNREIPLELELSFLDSYLSIQKGRYEEKLRYSIDIDQDLYSYHIPAFLLQPIVENSIVHGCEARKEKTTINIYSRYEDASITIYIEDDGPGIPGERLLQLQMKMDCPDDGDYQPGVDGKSSTVGLANVNKRIKLKYGEKYGLHIYSRAGGGTMVKVCLPVDNTAFENKKEAENHVQASDRR